MHHGRKGDQCALSRVLPRQMTRLLLLHPGMLVEGERHADRQEDGGVGGIQLTGLVLPFGVVSGSRSVKCR